MTDGMLSLSWNNHKATFCHILSTLREKERYTDVTVACEGRFYPVHKLVLSTCSEYFEKIFENTPCKHPVIVLKDIASDELEALLSYMYDGVVSVAQNDLARLIKAAEVLKIKGLAVPDEPPPPLPRNRRAAQSRNNVSDDRSSPHPKRRRREENTPSQNVGHNSPITSPRVIDSENDPLRQADTRWADHSEDNTDKPLDDRLHGSTTTSAAQPMSEVLVDDSLVKEEVDDASDHRDDVMDYGSLGSDSRLDGSCGGDGDNSSSQLLPKYEKNGGSQSQPNQSLPEAVVEALAGPSGMQGWLGGCDPPGGYSGMEGYSGDSSQDMHPPQQGGPGGAGQSQAHQMVAPHGNVHNVDVRDAWRLEGGIALQPHTNNMRYRDTPLQSPVKHTRNEEITYLQSTSHTPRVYHCSQCTYTTDKASHYKDHLLTHTGERPFRCPFCPYTCRQKSNLKPHVRKHMGEKPFACTLCQFRTAYKSNLTVHMLMHK